MPVRGSISPSKCVIFLPMVISTDVAICRRSISSSTGMDLGMALAIPSMAWSMLMPCTTCASTNLSCDSGDCMGSLLPMGTVWNPSLHRSLSEVEGDVGRCCIEPVSGIVYCMSCPKDRQLQYACNMLLPCI